MEKEEIIVAEKQTEILLESGTNELELLEFMVGTQHYGINVAKIRELCQYQTPTPVPNAHPFIEGIFMPRDMLITVINLSKALGISESENIFCEDRHASAGTAPARGNRF